MLHVTVIGVMIITCCNQQNDYGNKHSTLFPLAHQPPSQMAKTATGERCFSPLFFLIPHAILETATKAATKAANNKTEKAGEYDAYMRVLHSFATVFPPCLHPTLTDYTFHRC